MTSSAAHTHSANAIERKGRDRFNLRRRSAEHPMAMFSFAAGTALLAMAFVPSAGPAFASLDRVAPVEDTGTQKTAATSDVDMACRGQAWGAESGECLAQIVKNSGKGDRLKVRRLAAAEPAANAPNVY